MILKTLETLTLTGVDITVKMNKKVSLVILKFQGETYKGTSSSLDKAAEKALKDFEKHDLTLSHKRKQKKQERREVGLDGVEPIDVEPIKVRQLLQD